MTAAERWRTGHPGTREDTTGPRIADWLEQRATPSSSPSSPTRMSRQKLTRVVATAPALILTTGGTGMSPTDQTPRPRAPS